jgi:hypothetical protein
MRPLVSALSRLAPSAAIDTATATTKRTQAILGVGSCAVRTQLAPASTAPKLERTIPELNPMNCNVVSATAAAAVVVAITVSTRPANDHRITNHAYTEQRTLQGSNVPEGFRKLLREEKGIFAFTVVVTESCVLANVGSW